jgi:hypothetical protein
MAALEEKYAPPKQMAALEEKYGSLRLTDGELVSRYGYLRASVLEALSQTFVKPLKSSKEDWMATVVWQLGDAVEFLETDDGKLTVEHAKELALAQLKLAISYITDESP